MTQQVGALLFKLEDLSSSPQNPCKKPSVCACTCNPIIMGRHRGFLSSVVQFSERLRGLVWRMTGKSWDWQGYPVYQLTFRRQNHQRFTHLIAVKFM